MSEENKDDYSLFGKSVLIDLDKRRQSPGYVFQIGFSEVSNLDLSTVRPGDWLEGVGTVDDSASGFLYRLQAGGYRLTKRN